jgi:hypothetical protein
MNAMISGVWPCLDDVFHEGCMLLENPAPNIRDEGGS